MSKKVLKFESRDTIKFIEIYRKHECLWDTENVNYKSREARNVALSSFAEEFGVDGFGPKEITIKIKNLRTQYHGERKKIKASMGAGSDSGSVYKPKLAWYNLMNSFLLKTPEDRETTSYLEPDLFSNSTQNIYFFLTPTTSAADYHHSYTHLNENPSIRNNESVKIEVDHRENQSTQDHEHETNYSGTENSSSADNYYENENSLMGPDNTTFQYNVDNSEDVEDVKYFTTHVEVPSASPEFRTVKRPSISNYAHPSYDTLDVEKRAKLENRDDLEIFGKYVTSSLRTLSAKNCIHAQDEIQSVLSKYKIRNLCKRRNSTRKAESCSSDSDGQR